MIDMYNVNQDANNYFDYYKIKKGDNLYQIGKSYNVNPALIAILNGLNLNDYIYPNETIMVPKEGYSYYVTKSGDTLNLVANTFNTSVSNILRNNETIYLQEGQLIVNKISE